MRIARLGAYVASTTLALSGLSLVAAPAEAVTHDPIGVDQGASWLKGQLEDGIVHNDQYDFDDLGLTVDFALGLAAVNASDPGVDAIVDAIEPRAAADYYTYTDDKDVTTTYGGSLAKLAVLAQQSGAAVTDFGGKNLVTLLEAQVATAAPIAGRLQNTNDAFGDANVLGQAYAVNALSAADSSKADSATAFLLQQQCAAGFFRLNFSPKDAADQSCATASGAADTDATAIALQQLAEVESPSTAVSTALTTGRAWLRTTQKSDGSWGGGTSTEGSNSNSTGLAALALGGGADSEEAAVWLRQHQATYYDVCDKLASQRGAIAYDDLGLAAGRTDGITEATQDQWRRASAQAVPALAYLPVDATPAKPTLTGPTGYVKAGARPVLAIGGVSAGDQLCLTGVGTAKQGTATGTSWSTAVTLPAGTATRNYTVRDADGHSAKASIKVLGAKTLTVARTPGVVKRSRTVTVAARGLAAGETAKIYYGSRLVKSGAASSTGNLVVRFSSGTSLGTKSIRAYGRFTDIRKGATSLRVVR